MNAESVISNTSQPVTTQIIPIEADWSSVETHSSRKSLKAKDGASLEMVLVIEIHFRVLMFYNNTYNHFPGVRITSSVKLTLP